MHVTLVYFEVFEITKACIGKKKLNNLLDNYGLRNMIITYVKDGGSNLNTMTSVLKFVMKCEILVLEETEFQGTCFGCVFSKGY
jgi:hypothetical protein